MKFYSLQLLKADEGFEFTFNSSSLKSHKNWLGREQDESYSVQEDQAAGDNSNTGEEADSRLREAKCRGWFCFEQQLEGLSLISIRFVELEEVASENEIEETASRVVQETDPYRSSGSEPEPDAPVSLDTESQSSSKAITSSRKSPKRIRILKEVMLGWLLIIISLVLVQTLMKKRQYAQIKVSSDHLSRLIMRNDLIIKCASLLRRYEATGE